MSSPRPTALKKSQTATKAFCRDAEKSVSLWGGFSDIGFGAKSEHCRLQFTGITKDLDRSSKTSFGAYFFLLKSS